MAFRRKHRDFDQDPFTDLLFNALLGFTFMFLVAIMFLNPPTKTGIVDPKAEYIITATWEEGRPDDLDLWVQGPGNEVVWFRNQEADLMHLDRDDRGTVNDQLVVDGQAVKNPLNQEVVTIRGQAPGEYIVNLHYYNTQTKRPLDAEVEIVKVNPRLEVVYHGTVRLERLGQEKTAARFTVARDGSVTDVNTLPASLVSVDR
ncbi:hypothetical protein [Spectribacter hydrogenoxidans]|uniref:Biopolymer transport protein ExbD/TolR n=1 Tax=Spectribacter hydrogenoxidans TaxID=3075608 RepID=A0ABU3BX03_9GAMM|nr:hypothetical protein [Salinisphaera sp. W335]MDT0633817.1 hypothetical protein [Salinisphaera sp. W335]